MFSGKEWLHVGITFQKRALKKEKYKLGDQIQADLEYQMKRQQFLVLLCGNEYRLLDKGQVLLGWCSSHLP